MLEVTHRLLQATQVERMRWVQHKSTAFFTDIIPCWDGALFKQNFRVSRVTFMYLHSQLRAALDMVDFLHRPIPADKRLAIVLWRLGTNIEYQTVSHLFGVGIFTVCGIVHLVCNAIVHTFVTMYVKIPQGVDLDTIVNGFQQRWQFPHCAGAYRWNPHPHHCAKEQSTGLLESKQFYSILMQAVVDHRYLFRDIYIGWPGSVHNASVLANSDDFVRAQSGTLFLDK